MIGCIHYGDVDEFDGEAGGEGGVRAWGRREEVILQAKNREQRLCGFFAYSDEDLLLSLGLQVWT